MKNILNKDVSHRGEVIWDGKGEIIESDHNNMFKCEIKELCNRYIKIFTDQLKKKNQDIDSLKDKLKKLEIALNNQANFAKGLSIFIRFAKKLFDIDDLTSDFYDYLEIPRELIKQFLYDIKNLNKLSNISADDYLL